MENNVHTNNRSLDLQQLIQGGELIQRSIQSVVEESSKHPASSANPSWALYEAQRNIISATGVLTELVSNPSMRLMEVSGQYWESRALAILVAKRIPDLLASSAEGLSLNEISTATGIEEAKLGRVLRCLASSHILREPLPGIFANNRISSELVQNEPLRAYILHLNASHFPTAEHLPSTLLDPEWGQSYDVRKTAFQKALGTSKSYWEWLQSDVGSTEEEKETSRTTNYPDIVGQNQEKTHAISDMGSGQRPESALFSLGMLGAGRVATSSHIED